MPGNWTANEQKLVDLCFACVLQAEQLAGRTNEEKAEWVRRQLTLCGFPTEPCGMSWGVLMSGPQLSEGTA